MRTGGIVLCGGQSSRMGSSKAWLPIGGEPMLARIVRIISSVVSPIVIVAAEGQELPPLPVGVRVVRDALPGRGPLQGIVEGQTELDGEVESAFVTSCDLPLLKAEFVKFVIEQLADFDAAVPRIEGRWQPLAAVYRLAPALREANRLLTANRFAVRELFETLNVIALGMEDFRGVDPDLDSLRNANTSDEFEMLCQRIFDCSQT